MKKIILLAVLFSLIQNAQSQDISFDLKKGEIKRDKITKRTFGIELLGSDNEFVYYTYLPFNAVFNEKSIGGNENYFIAKFDKDLNEVKKGEINLINKNRKTQIHGIFYIKNDIYMFTAFQNEEHKKHYLFVQNINKETLLVEDNIQKIGEIDYSGINKYKNTFFHHEFSPDSSKILIYYNVVNKRRENIKYGMYVYSDKMDLIWKNENVIPEISEGVFSYQKFRIDNKGNVYLKGVNYTNLKNYYASANFKERGFFSKDVYFADFPNYITQIYMFTENGNKKQHINISLQNKFVRSLTFLPNKDGKLFCAGIYSNSGTLSAKGAFSFEIDINSKKIAKLDYKEFEKDIIELGFDENELKKFRKSIDNKEEWDPFKYLLSDIKINKNGEKYFIAEQFIEGTKVEKSGNKTYYSTIYLHNDIYVIRLSKENKLDQIDKISKRQYSTNTDKFSSYALFEKDNNLYFAFMEILKKNTMLKNAKPGNTYLVELNKNGDVRKSIIKSSESKDKLYLITKTGVKFSENELIYSTGCQKLKDYSVEKITLTN